eukprot:GHVQ01008405.1.p1 GENE.GHVQ01008405.1~~GHVQ01008405.1.p1  ORF type:complete len:140 (-),score=27.68 GHVQ01008405.1:715-1134(-)
MAEQQQTAEPSLTLKRPPQNAVNENAIWKQQIQREYRYANEWSNNWEGLLTDKQHINHNTNTNNTNSNSNSNNNRMVDPLSTGKEGDGQLCVREGQVCTEIINTAKVHTSTLHKMTLRTKAPKEKFSNAITSSHEIGWR